MRAPSCVIFAHSGSINLPQRYFSAKVMLRQLHGGSRMYIRFSSVCAVAFAGQLAASVALAQTPSPPPFGPAVDPGRALSLTDLTNLNPLIPADIYRNASVAHADLATFAWLEFISAVAPVAAGQRGVPGGSFAASGGAQDGSQVSPLVWEPYQHRTELLPCTVSGGKVLPPQ